MPKKVSSESPPATQEEPASKQKKPKKAGNEIEEIFSNKKRKKSEQKQVDKPREDVNPGLKKMKKEKKGKVARTDSFVEPPAKQRKKTGDGLVIYTEEEIGIGRADAGVECIVVKAPNEPRRWRPDRTKAPNFSRHHKVAWVPRRCLDNYGRMSWGCATVFISILCLLGVCDSVHFHFV